MANLNDISFQPIKSGQLPDNEIAEQYKSLLQSGFLEEVFSKMPTKFLIVNECRQIVYVNGLMSEELGEGRESSDLGLRPGEVLGCKYAFVEPSGCGTSHKCTYCGMVNSVLEAFAQNTLIVKETCFESEKSGELKVTDFEVSAKPFVWQGKRYAIVVLSDISLAKRKEYIEKIFFHDLLNKVTTVSFVSETLDLEDNKENKRLLDVLRKGISDLSNEIVFQRSLTEAEMGKFNPNLEPLNSLEIIEGIKDDFLSYKFVADKSVEIEENSCDVDFLSDSVVLNRILINLVKNALEAIKHGQTVSIGSTIEGEIICFKVRNSTRMSEDVQNQLFKRSFSTKGKGRGMGSYSVKLFTEQYLGGSVSFESDEDNGTTFYVRIPIAGDD